MQFLEEELYYVGNDKSTKKKVLTEMMAKTEFICKNYKIDDL